MRTSLIAVLALTACGGTVTQDPHATPTGGGRSPDHATARDGDAAVREEFAAAESANTAEAYRRFADRHPDHPLAAVARERAAVL